MPRCYMMKKKGGKSTTKANINRARTKATSKHEDSNTKAVYTPLTNRPRRSTRDNGPSSSSSPSGKSSRDSDYHSIHSVYRARSAEETEAAHDLLSLSQSLPPLQAPGVVTVADDIQDDHSSSPILSYRPLSADKIKPDSPQVLYLVPLPHRDNPTPPSSDCSMDAMDHVDPLIVQTATIRMQGQCGPVTTGDDIIILPLSPEPERRSCEIETQTEEPLVTIRVALTNERKSKEEKGGKNRRKAKRKQDENSNSSNIDTNSPKKIKTKFFTVVEDDRVSTIAEETDSKTRFICGVCGKQYATSSNLSRHKQTHRSLDSHSAKKCMTCGKAYVSMPALAMHVLTHKLNHSCGICGKQFSRPWLLQGHLRSHTGERPYGCAHCGKRFADRSNLRAHMQTHSEAKNYKCTICQKTFALKSYLNKHLESSCQIGSPDDQEADDPECVASK